MKYIIKLIIILSLISSIYSCKDAAKVNSGQKSNNLIESLQSIKDKGILFGHQDDLAYGKNWKYIDGESDVKRVSGDYPAVFGWELGGLERGDQVNLDSVPFSEMLKLVLEVDQMGGVNTFSWHPYSLVNGENSWNTDTTVVKHIIHPGALHKGFINQLDKVAEFLLQIKKANGEPIPFIFRPWHEMNGNWFWWGKDLTSPDEFKQLFRFTIKYLTETKGLKNMLICYSPNGGYKNAEEYLTWYPGDDIIDMLAVDQYEWGSDKNWVKKTQKYLKIMIQLANEKGKLAAFSETGCENLPDSLWFTNKLGKAIAEDGISKNLSYVLVWRNDPKVHHFFSYEGHSSVNDAKTFLSKPYIWLLNDYNSKK